MKKLIILMLICLICAASFFGCDDTGAGTASVEAAITAFTGAGLVGTPNIDLEAHTVSLTVEPMDLSNYSPELVVSDYAEVTSAPGTIADGVPATYTVTAEDGTAVDWKVTVNVLYGVAFDYGTRHIVLTEGEIYSGDPEFNEYVGDGVPGIYSSGSSNYFTVYSEVYDYGSESRASEPPTYEYDYDYFEFYFEGESTEIYSSASAEYYESDGFVSTDFDCSVDVSEHGDIGGDFRASFSGVVDEIPVASRASADPDITGYCKLLVVEGPPR